MKTYKFSFKPKGKSYRVYRTNKVHSKKTNLKKRRGLLSDTITHIAANAIVHSVFADNNFGKIQNHKTILDNTVQELDIHAIYFLEEAK